MGDVVISCRSMEDDVRKVGEVSVLEGRDAYLAENDFSIDAYTAPTFTVQVFGKALTFPNRPSRQRVIPLHDLHHVATGYGTDLVGEAEIGAWELVAGCNTPFLVAINATAAVLGMLLAPRRVVRAALAARGQRTLYVRGAPYDELLSLSVAELRERLGVPAGGATSTNADQGKRTIDRRSSSAVIPSPSRSQSRARTAPRAARRR
jgi:hypothetical protein